MVDLSREPYGHLSPRARARKFGDIGRHFKRAASQAPTERAKAALRAYAKDCLRVEAAILMTTLAHLKTPSPTAE